MFCERDGHTVNIAKLKDGWQAIDIQAMVRRVGFLSASPLPIRMLLRQLSAACSMVSVQDATVEQQRIQKFRAVHYGAPSLC
jgi:hypothetical protein